MKSDKDIELFIKNYVEDALGDFSELTWAYVVLSKSNMSLNFYVTNYPDEWVMFYKEKRLYFTDPVVITARTRLTPFEWDKSLIINSGYHYTGLFDQAEEFDLIKGNTFVVHDFNNNLATLTFITSRGSKPEIVNKLTQKRGDISLLLASIHETYLALTYPPTENMNKIDKKTVFTKRENEVLYWYSMGKTYQETSIILGIKLRTVKFHMSNIVKKMGVTNARHAVRFGIEHGLIKPEI